MDPYVAAALLAFTEFNKFLQTPPGQKLAEANNEIIGKILDKLGVHLAVNAPAEPPKA